jgi:peptidoglycan hydrolase-like protein with peptidoglycan-binding domain
MAANPSALLLLTCVTCTDAANQSTPTNFSTCPETQTQNQGESAVSVTEPVRCVSSPEMVAVAQTGRLRATTNSQTLVAQVSSQQAQPQQNSLGRPVPQPAAPETFYSMQTTSGGQTSSRSQSSPLLRLGSRGEAVSKLQQQLQQLGHYTGAIDGVYGKKTEAAVAKFQQVSGLGVDGIVGPSTWQKLQARSGSVPTADSDTDQDTANSASTVPDPDATQADTEPPSGSSAPEEETESPPVPAASELRDQPNAAPQPVRREPIENDNLYYWMLVWALVYGGGNVFIFWNRTISNLWFYSLEKMLPQWRKKPGSQPADVASKKAAAPTAATSTPSQPTKPTIDRPTPPSVQTSAKPAHPTPQVSSISTETAHQPSDQTIVAQSSSSLDQAAVHANITEPVLVAALANGGVIEPLQNLVVDLSPSFKRHTATSTHRQPQKLKASTARVNIGSRNRSPLVASAPTSISKNMAGNQRMTPGQAEAVSSPKLNNGQAQPSDKTSILVATLPSQDSKSGMTYTYTLLDDAEGCFKIEGNELRIISEAVLNVPDKSRHVVRVRRTDAKGSAAEKSFILNLNKSEDVKSKSSSNSSVRPIQPFPLAQPG